MKSMTRRLSAGLAALFLLSAPFAAHALSSPFLSASETTTLKFDDNIKYQQNVFTRDVRRVTPTVKAPAQTENSRAVVAAPITTVTPVVNPPAQTTPSIPVVTPGNTNPPPAPTVPTRSIRTFGAVCDGMTDDRDHFAAALDAAKNNAFTLIVDCPVFLHVGSDIAKPLFFENGTTIAFTSVPNDPANSGKIIVDNVLIASFLIANASNINLIDWSLEYRGGLPVDWYTGGYYNNNVWVPSTGYAPQSGAFNDITLKNWYIRNRGIVFNGTSAIWAGPTNASSIFFITGTSSNILVKNFHMFVDQNANGSQFAPMVFSSTQGYRSNQTVTRSTPINSTYAAVPSYITFDTVTLDGYYMGWQGKFQNTVWKTIRALRYGDLQDANGNNVGGIGKWFAPPHLFYINYDITQTGLEVSNVSIDDVIDSGPRSGRARDQLGEPQSGYTNSLKIGGYNVSVNHYTSYRPDGFADILGGRNMTFQNVYATYDSSFLSNMYSSLRFPVGAPYSYQDMTMRNITLIDTAAVTSRAPVASSSIAENSNVTIDINATINKWANGRAQTPVFTGTGINLNVRYTVLNP